MKQALLRFWRDEEGATAIEYGLIAGLIVVGLLTAFTEIGTKLKTVFESISSSLGA